MLAGRNLNFELVRRGRSCLRRHFLVGLDAGLALGLPRSRRHANPFEFCVQRLLPGRGGLLFRCQPILLLLEPRGVVAFPGNAPAAVEFQNPAGHVVEEVAIVGDGHDRAGVFGQMPLEPGHAFGVEMVRRLVEQQQVGAARSRILHSATRRRSPPESFVTSASPGGRFMASMAISIWRSSSQALWASIWSCTLACSSSSFSISSGLDGLAQPGVDLVVAVQACAAGGGDGLFDVAPDVFVGIELRLLREIADGEAVGQLGLAFELVVHAGHDPQQRALARAVAAQHADLGARIERQPDVLEHLALAVFLGEVARFDRCIACP